MRKSAPRGPTSRYRFFGVERDFSGPNGEISDRWRGRGRGREREGGREGGREGEVLSDHLHYAETHDHGVAGDT